MIIATVLLGPGSADIVAEAIQSAEPYVDGFWLCESGGGPDAIAAAATAMAWSKRYWKYFMVWPDHYGQARNSALACARGLGAEWAFTVDPDERVRLGDPKKFRKLLADHPNVDVWSARDVDGRYIKPRVIRCSNRELKWEGSCNELLERKGPTGVLAGGFRELPKTPEQERARVLRGIEKMPAEIARDPDNAHWHRHYATCLLLEGRHSDARRAFCVAAERAVNSETKAWCRYKAAQCFMLEGDYDTALEVATEGLADNAQFLAEFASVMAHCYYRRRRPQNAKAWATIAVERGPDKDRFGFQDGACVGNAQSVLDALEPDTVTRFGGDAFAKREALRADYQRFGAAVASAVGEVESVIDLGAGQGLLLDALHGWLPGAKFAACELEETAREHASAFAESVTSYGVPMGRWPAEESTLVCCVEVAEHIPETEADDVVFHCVALAEQYILWSAAQPGQGGLGHVNEQPLDYWLDKFSGYGFELHHDATKKMREAMGEMKAAPWLRRNAVILAH